jgi:hypothetical protein
VRVLFDLGLVSLCYTFFLKQIKLQLHEKSPISMALLVGFSKYDHIVLRAKGGLFKAA